MDISTSKVLDGKALAKKVQTELKDKIQHLLNKGHRPPCLATVLVGDDEASKVYINMKRKRCEELGIRSLHFKLDSDVTIEEIRRIVEDLNERGDVDGILVQMPFPAPLRRYEPMIMRLISPAKDVDGFHPQNIGENTFGHENLSSCTPKGMIRLLEEYKIPIEGQEVVIVNRTNVIGKPLAMMFVNRSATVTICHSKTRDLDFHLKRADIIAVGVGKVNFLTADRIKPGVTILDAGINRNPEGKLVGDADYEGVLEKCGAITPVPGGLGPMTIAMLMENTYLSYIEPISAEKAVK